MIPIEPGRKAQTLRSLPAARGGDSPSFRQSGPTSNRRSYPHDACPGRISAAQVAWEKAEEYDSLLAEIEYPEWRVDPARRVSAARRKALPPVKLRNDFAWQELCRAHVGQLDTGACLGVCGGSPGSGGRSCRGTRLSAIIYLASQHLPRKSRGSVSEINA